MSDGEHNDFTQCLDQHAALQSRRSNATKRIESIASEFAESMRFPLPNPVTVFCAGSLGRGDVGSHSDLDLFIITELDSDERNELDEIEVLSEVIQINRRQGFGPFSNKGRYLKVYSMQDLLQSLGNPQDDAENFFTARMLMLLESRCVFNDEFFVRAVDQIVNKYFRDSRGKQEFIPLFLLNDLLRYWRTLCLNYELIRDSQAPWRKKNINLKFSRMLTVFGTVLPLIAGPLSTKEDVRLLVNCTPHERFAQGLDRIGDKSLLDGYSMFLDDYEHFVGWKEEMSADDSAPSPQLDTEYRKAAERFSNFIFSAVSHGRIDPRFRKFLVI